VTEKFNADLKLGKQREDCLGGLLDRQLGDWLELKYDERCRMTGNLFVEDQQPDRSGGVKNSGIATSTADYWAFEYDDFSYLIVPTPRLRMLFEATRAERGYTMGGDGRAYRGVLIPAERLVLPESLWARVDRDTLPRDWRAA
jgi:hypothetical protein